MILNMAYQAHQQKSNKQPVLPCICACASASMAQRLTFSVEEMLKSYLPDREASLIKKEYCRCGPHPLQVISSRARLDLHLSRERATLAPSPRNSGVGHSGLWPPLHCGDPKHLHRRLLQAPHCTLRLSHPSAGGNARGPGIVSQLDMQEPGLGDYCWPTATGC